MEKTPRLMALTVVEYFTDDHFGHPYVEVKNKTGSKYHISIKDTLYWASYPTHPRNAILKFPDYKIGDVIYGWFIDLDRNSYRKVFRLLHIIENETDYKEARKERRIFNKTVKSFRHFETIDPIALVRTYDGFSQRMIDLDNGLEGYYLALKYKEEGIDKPWFPVYQILTNSKIIETYIKISENTKKLKDALNSKNGKFILDGFSDVYFHSMFGFIPRMEDYKDLILSRILNPYAHKEIDIYMRLVCPNYFTDDIDVSYFGDHLKPFVGKTTITAVIKISLKSCGDDFEHIDNEKDHPLL